MKKLLTKSYERYLVTHKKNVTLLMSPRDLSAQLMMSAQIDDVRVS